ncbi:MAG: hypothetical protein NTW20_10835, partial [Rhodobacterales bacterium]|nr:hypothetical protein [Rhodobacterales bacterium]
MTRRLVAVALSFQLAAFAAGAEVGPDCGQAATALTSHDGYDVTIPPAGPDEGWCVLDGASFRSRMPGWPDLAVRRLRLRQTATEIELDLAGLRAAPGPAHREVDDR